MPTGYTAQIAKGISFKDFTLQCARAFGALVTMREDSHDAVIPDEFKPDEYHQNSLNDAHDKIERLKAMDAESCEREAGKEYGDAINFNNATIAERRALHDKYTAMLLEVNKWQPPTKDHEGIKKFMVEQITGSMEFDCSTEYNEEALKTLIPLTGEQWREAQLKKAKEDANYHAEEWEEEKLRCQNRSEWVQQLKKSLA